MLLHLVLPVHIVVVLRQEFHGILPRHLDSPVLQPPGDFAGSELPGEADELVVRRGVQEREVNGVLAGGLHAVTEDQPPPAAKRGRAMVQGPAHRGIVIPLVAEDLVHDRAEDDGIDRSRLEQGFGDVFPAELHAGKALPTAADHFGRAVNADEAAAR